MNIKHQPLLKKQQQKTVSSYATAVKYVRWKRDRQQFAVSNSIRMFGQCP